MNTIKWYFWEAVIIIRNVVRAVIWYVYTCWRSWCILPMVRVQSYRQAKIANTVLVLCIAIAVLITVGIVKA